MNHAIEEMRVAEVETLRAEVKRLRWQMGELRNSLEEFMQPRGASEVIEAWVCVDIAPSTEKLELLTALRKVCVKEGWL